MSEANRVAAYLKVTAEFYDPEATPETVRACVEQDLEDAGYDVEVVPFDKGNNALNKWISVKKNLPPRPNEDEYTEYIVHIIDDDGNWAIGIAEWHYSMGVGVWRIGPDCVTLPDGMYITHWMGTPAPPEDET